MNLSYKSSNLYIKFTFLSFILSNYIYAAHSNKLNNLDLIVANTSIFQIQVYAKNIGNPRFMALTPRGDILVTDINNGKVKLLEINNNNLSKPKNISTIVKKLNQPHGIYLDQDILYIGETNKIGAIKLDLSNYNPVSKYVTILDNLPKGGHFTRTIVKGPDDYMYLSIGSSCNVCIEKHPWRATIVRFKTKGLVKINKSEVEIFAKGLRNSVGLDWSPEDNKLYATDNGRDWLGDNFPPCELNIINKGSHYGWPFRNGTKKDPNFGNHKQSKALNFTSPIYEFGAHNAPLGLRFLKNDKLPKEYINSALVALHGSWNSAIKVGYKVVAISHDKISNKYIESDFITGFLKNGIVRGRPVDIIEGKNNDIFISDDFAGMIYRVTYN